jgi:dTDP-4-dehydrorhamnose reductase
MRVLVLGGSGLLGHKLWQVLSKRFSTWFTVRAIPEAALKAGILDPKWLVENVDGVNVESVIHAIASLRPDVVVNAIGVVKQSNIVKDAVTAITINSLLPHQLAAACHTHGARLIHISTDCVFSGRKGRYVEDDPADPGDLYGRSKLLGEVTECDSLTLRTSIIGPELNTCRGLLEWFLSNRDKTVRGYTRAIFSGFPTVIFANTLVEIIANQRTLKGLYHVSADPINKYDLLCLLRDAYEISVQIEPFSDVHIDRSLDSSRFRSATGFVPSSWREMVACMAADQRLKNRDSSGCRAAHRGGAQGAE